MSNDLISRKKLLEDMKRHCIGNCKRCENYTILASDHHCGLIDEQPTAYEVDAVVRELEGERKSAYDRFEKYKMPSFWREAYAYVDAIKIVLRGGRNE